MATKVSRSCDSSRCGHARRGAGGRSDSTRAGKSSAQNVGKEDGPHEFYMMKKRSTCMLAMSEDRRLARTHRLTGTNSPNPIVGYKLQKRHGSKSVIVLEEGCKRGRVRDYCVFVKWASKWQNGIYR